MIYFNSAEILTAVLASVVYGCIISLLMGLLRSLRACIRRIRFAVLCRPHENGTERSIPSKIKLILGESRQAASVVLFFIGYLLLSYYALDGLIRVYTLAVSLFSTWLFRCVYDGFLAKYVEAALWGVCYVPTLIIKRARGATLKLKLHKNTK